MTNRRRRRIRLRPTPRETSEPGKKLPDWFIEARKHIQQRNIEKLVLLLARNNSTLLRTKVGGSSLLDIMINNGDLTIINDLLERNIVYYEEAYAVIEQAFDTLGSWWSLQEDTTKQLKETFDILGDAIIGKLLNIKLVRVVQNLIKQIKEQVETDGSSNSSLLSDTMTDLQNDIMDINETIHIDAIDFDEQELEEELQHLDQKPETNVIATFPVVPQGESTEILEQQRLLIALDDSCVK